MYAIRSYYASAWGTDRRQFAEQQSETADDPGALHRKAQQIVERIVTDSGYQLTHEIDRSYNFV